VLGREDEKKERSFKNQMSYELFRANLIVSAARLLFRLFWMNLTKYLIAALASPEGASIAYMQYNSSRRIPQAEL
jgi:hypothetical protein